ncbi:hypothetical protein [Thalassoporum mexicanum]|uniref:hypothetical protein n=1 Tax=Thalassoporum mexicanum TaxID=3457544 RepID=UPI0012E9AE7F|nr:hypothetical protein [Pseudanabaena sp. PCC 7367]
MPRSTKRRSASKVKSNNKNNQAQPDSFDFKFDFKKTFKNIRPWLYIALGSIAFTLTSTADLPPLIRNYMLIGEAQLGLIFLYFFIRNARRRDRDQ